MLGPKLGKSLWIPRIDLEIKRKTTISDGNLDDSAETLWKSLIAVLGGKLTGRGGSTVHSRPRYCTLGISGVITHGQRDTNRPPAGGGGYTLWVKGPNLGIVAKDGKVSYGSWT